MTAEVAYWRGLKGDQKGYKGWGKGQKGGKGKGKTRRRREDSKDTAITAESGDTASLAVS